MAERRGSCARCGRVDAVALLATAAALVAAPAQAATTALFADGFSDPSIDGATLALQHPGGRSELRSPTGVQPLPGNHPAVGGGPRRLDREPDRRRSRAAPSYPAPGADAVAIDAGLGRLARRARALRARRSPAGRCARSSPAPVGRPALSGALLVFDYNGRIESVDLAQRPAHDPAPRAGRATARAVRARRPARLHPGDLQAPAGALGPLAPQLTTSDSVLYGTFPSGRRDLGYEPGHEHAEGHKRQLWPRPPAGVADTLTTTAVAADGSVYFTRVRQLERPQPAPRRGRCASRPD